MPNAALSRPVRVLVVDDSRTVRERLSEVLDATGDLRVVGTAADGRAAVASCAALLPDVVTMDLGLPVMSGLAATEQIMAHTPTPILVVSGAGTRELAFEACDVLAAGAVDALSKPGADAASKEWDAELVARVRRVAKIRVITHVRGRRPASPLAAPAAHAPSAGGPQTDPGPTGPADATDPPTTPRIVALGTSTGGPAALLEILRALPPTFDHPVLIVLHLGAPAGDGLAEWLGAHVPWRVAFAAHGELLPPPGERRVVLAPPDRHLAVRSGRLVLSAEPPRHGCRPAVDVLFESLAAEMGSTTVAALLTGMGRDGAAGLLAIRSAGGMTLAQDEGTSVVFGMPGEAVRLGAARAVLPLGEIAPAIASLCRPRVRALR